MVPFGKDALDYPGFTIIYKASIPDDVPLSSDVVSTDWRANFLEQQLFVLVHTVSNRPLTWDVLEGTVCCGVFSAVAKSPITVTMLGRVFRGHLVSIIITDITMAHGTCPPTKKMLRRDKTDDFEGKKLYDNTKIKASVVSWPNN